MRRSLTRVLTTWRKRRRGAHARRLGIVTDAVHQAVDLARARDLALPADRAGPPTGQTLPDAALVVGVEQQGFA